MKFQSKKIHKSAIDYANDNYDEEIVSLLSKGQEKQKENEIKKLLKEELKKQLEAFKEEQHKQLEEKEEEHKKQLEALKEEHKMQLEENNEKFEKRLDEIFEEIQRLKEMIQVLQNQSTTTPNTAKNQK